MSLHHNLSPQNPPNPHHIPPPPPHHHHPMAAAAVFAPRDHHQSSKQSYPPKSKAQSLTLSDDDEPGGAAAENSADDGKRKLSPPWQRMKWTDNMVRLLIMVVFYIGDEVGPEGNDHPSSAAAAKKKGSGALQKKGKWKSVSRAMMERGFYVSPQQCEDKFNDLNKRYKRVNDILGKGTSCRVVENQSLLDSMDLPPKLKEEVKKLLNSKHLFFREMCAYHNSCGHAPEAAPQQKCLHSADKGPNLNRGVENNNEGSKSSKGDEEEEDDDEEEDDEDEEDDYEDDDNDNDMDERCSRKRGRASPASSIAQLDAEIASAMRDGGRTPTEKRQWLKKKQMALEEQRVGIQSQSLELEKQRLKWLKFSSKKEREMEREKLVNEKTRLENERMVLLIRQKEMDLMDNLHHHPSSITG